MRHLALSKYWFRDGCSLLTLILVIFTVALVAYCVTKCQEVIKCVHALYIINVGFKYGQSSLPMEKGGVFMQKILGLT